MIPFTILIADIMTRPLLVVCALLLCALCAHSSLQSQTASISGADRRPLGEVLAPDGTIRRDADFTGSLDPAGWTMKLGEDGQPRFAPVGAAAPGDEHWDGTFDVPGPSATVLAVAVSGVDVYIGGVFTSVGSVPANNIAHWNGSAWSALGSGTNLAVNALVISGSDLYAGGLFSTAGGVAAQRVAKWNGSTWSALGSGLNSTVHALAVSGADLYVGGRFTTAGGSSARYIAKWDGSSWSALGSGLDSNVYAIAAGGGNLYVGGAFDSAGGAGAAHIALWNGSAWSTLGAGVNGAVQAIAVNGTDIYAGGAFTTAGGSSAQRTAKWDGAAWSALGTGVSNTVYAIAISGSNIYVGGDLLSAGGSPAQRIAKWDGSAWSALGSGVGGSVNSIAAYGDTIVAGGAFLTAGSVAASNLARWNGVSWAAMAVGAGMSDAVFALAKGGSTLYAGGDFLTAGTAPANYIAKFDGASWSALGTGTNGRVYALALIGSDLYAAGMFLNAGGVLVNFIGKWNGSSWSALGSGVNNVVHALATDGTNLYAGGEFTMAGGSPANYIAKWNGSTWSSLGTGMNARVDALLADGGNVYAGGDFTSAGGVSATRVAKWDGAGWSAMGTGMSHRVEVLAKGGGYVYAGGGFPTAGGVTVNGVARWDGVAWSPVGGGVIASVYSMAAIGNDLYVGGDFLSAGGVTRYSIAKWDGFAWSSLGSGMNSFSLVSALTADSVSLFAGGGFLSAGGKPSRRIARWAIPPPSTILASAGPNGAVSPSGAVSVTYGSTQPFSITPNANHHLDSLLVDGLLTPDSTTSYTFKEVTANHSLRAVFRINSYAISASSGANGSISPSGSVSVVHGGNQVFTITPAPGYHTDSVIVDGVNVPDSSASYTFTNVTSTHVLRVVFRVTTHTIVSSSGPNGTLTPLGAVLVNEGTSQRFTIAPNAGHHIDSLFVDGVLVADSTTGYTFYAVSAAHTIRAVFRINTYVLSASAGPNGSISPSGADTVTHGSNRTYTITPSPSYHVANVVVNGVPVGAVGSYTFTNITSNNSIHASFSINNYTITASAGPHGVISPSGSVGATAGDTLTFSLTPDVGYHTDSLIVDGAYVPDSTTSYTFVNVVANHTIRVVYRIDTFIISASAGSNGAITPNGDVVADYGSNAVFTISPSPGFHLDSLLVDGVEVFDSTTSYTFVGITGPHTIRATFLQYVSVNLSSGWNLLSVPSLLDNYAVAAVAPTATSAAFSFDGSYASQETLRHGLGYWVKFSGSQSLEFAGRPRLSDSIAVQAGWNLVGSTGIPIAAAGIASTPPGIVTSQFFQYNAGYSAATTVEPGRAYWVKADQAGLLILSGAGALGAANAIRIMPSAELPPPPPQTQDAPSSAPLAFRLGQNYPNPFNPLTVIRYDLPEDSRVTLTVYDLMGRRVATLVDGIQAAGSRSVVWDASGVSGGVYFYRIQAGNYTESKKLLLVR